jgi:hypothetical protein
MADNDFEIIVRYNGWNVEVYDNISNLLCKLNCKSNSLFSNYISGKTKINGNVFSILDSNKGISLTLNNSQIGHVNIATQNSYGRHANIEIEDEKFFFKRDDLKQRFAVTDNSNNILITIEGKISKNKQKNLFGLVFFDDKLYHSVSVSNPTMDKRILLYLMTICGYCIRLFLQIDTGDYYQKIAH